MLFLLNYREFGFQWLYNLVWVISIVVSTSGVVGSAIGWQPNGLILLAIGGSALALLAIGAELYVTLTAPRDLAGNVFIIVAGALIFILAVAFATNVLPNNTSTTVRLVTLTVGLQALLLTVDVRPPNASRKARMTILFASHGAVFAGSALTLEWGLSSSRGALLFYAVGFSTLILHGFWTRQQRPIVTPPQPNTPYRYWESLLLTAIIIGILTVVIIAFTFGTDALLSTPDIITRSAEIIGGVTAMVALSMLSVPSSPPKVLKFLAGPRATIIQHTFTLLILMNTLILAIIFVNPLVFPWILGGFLLLYLIDVSLNYWAVLYTERQLNDSSTSPSPLSNNVPVTVIVTALNEANVLEKTLSHNLETLRNIPFVLIPAAASTDDTLAIARKFEADYPDRIRVEIGKSGSKAGDLNTVWEHIDTPYVLILDADETVKSEFVTQGLNILREKPDVGIVQGRKAAACPSIDALSRFISIERQHSTWIDHPFIQKLFDANHFAGSAALFRHEVPLVIDGWSPDMLTEDIDLTLRLYLDTDWEIEYISEMVALECNPATFQGLVRQRERWARGWAQAAVRHGESIILSWRKLGWRQTVGLSWILFRTVSAPLYTIFPALLLHWFLTFAPSLSMFVSIIFALFLFPERAISYGYAALRDPVISEFKNPVRLIEVVCYAYIWILFGWVVQLHSLYLQLAGAPRVWHKTTKNGTRISPSSEKNEFIWLKDENIDESEFIWLKDENIDESEFIWLKDDKLLF